MKRYMVQSVGVDDTIVYNVIDTWDAIGPVIDTFDLHSRAIVEAMLLNEDDDGTARPSLD